MKQSKETLKTYFETGDRPTEDQFEALIDSYVDAKQPTGEADRRFVIDSEGEVTVTEKLSIPEYSLSNSSENKLSLSRDNQIINEVDLTGIAGNDLIKKQEITFIIDNLDTSNTYEILSSVGENNFPVLHKVVFDINITTAYDEFPTDNLFSLKLGSDLLLHSSPFISTNSLGRSMNISTVSSNVVFSNENFNESIYLKPNFNASNGALSIKIILFYSLIEF